MTTASEGQRRPGRPQRRDADGVETKDRLLDAATAACIEHGFEGTTLADIARRVDIRVPSIYNHYPNKTALLVGAARRAFDQRLAIAAPGRPAEVVAYFLQPELHETRRLVLEVHSAATRHPDVADLLDDWHRDAARTWRPFATGPDPDTKVKAFFLILVGLCHLEDFDAVPGSASGLDKQLATLTSSLFEDNDG